MPFCGKFASNFNPCSASVDDNGWIPSPLSISLFFACKTHASSWHECCKWQWFCAVNCVYSVLTKKSHNFSQTISNLIRQESLNNLQWKSLWFLWLGAWSIDSQIPTDFLFCSPSRCLDSEAPLDFTPVYCMWFIV